MSKKIAVAARIQDTGSRYRDIPKVKEMLDYLGVSIIRAGAVRYEGAASWKKFEELASYGVQMIMTVRDRLSPKQVVADLDQFASKYPGIIVGVEGPNEIDHNPVKWTDPKQGTTYTDAKGDARSTPHAALGFQKELRDRMRATPSLRKVPLIAFSDFQQTRQREEKIADYYNQHPYPREGLLLSDKFKIHDTKLKTVITETGAPSRPDPKFYPDADEDSQRAFIDDAVRMVLNDKAIHICAFYQLMDNYKDRTEDQSGGMEYYFGLFDYDYQPKPAAKRMRELLKGQ